MRAFWPERYADVASLEIELARFDGCCRFYLFDAGTGGGGHGRSFDVSRLKGLRTHKTWFLAGGLTPDTLMPAIAACAPCGVDLNSGVESAPGKKDPHKLAAVAQLLHGGVCENASCGEL